MTTTTDHDTDLVLAYLDGQLEASAKASFEARLEAEPALRAEVDGLVALRGVLDDDLAWGDKSGVDAPPPHLLQAILTAEVAARPDEIRQAAALARAPDADKKTFWARFSSWIVGGGALVGAAAAVLIVVNQNPKAAELAAPAATTLPAPAPVLPAAEPSPEIADTASARTRRTTESSTGANRDADDPSDPNDAEAERQAEGAAYDGLGKAEAASAVKGAAQAANQLADEKSADEKADTKADARFGDDLGGLALNAKTAPKDTALAEPRAVFDDEAPTPERAAVDKRNAIGTREDADSFGYGQAGGGRATGTSPSSGAPAPAAAAPAAPAADDDAVAPSPAKPAPRMVSAEEARESFLKQRAARSQAKKAKAKAPSKSSQSSSGAELDGRRPSEVAKEELAATQQLNMATQNLLAGENELRIGRPKSALELATRAEGVAGGRLGLAPAGLQAQAYWQLGQHQNAARVASRLLQGDLQDPIVVDGLLAGAQAASQIGDTRLARQLLQAALRPENRDAARRQKAQSLIAALEAPRAERKAAAVDSASEAPAAAADKE